MGDNQRAGSQAQIAAQDMVVGIFDSQDEANEVIDRLIDAGIQPDHISIVAKDFEARDRVIGYVTSGEVAREMAGTGAWVGGLFGLLTGAAFLWAPAVGPLVVLGPLVSGALGALQGGAVGGLLGAILGKQLENERVLKYERDLQAGKFLVVVHGTAPELETVRNVMGNSRGHDVETYQTQAA